MSISVVIPTYNRGAEVQKTIDSVLSQTLLPAEIIIVDDGSTDGTADWIEAHYGDKIRLIRQSNGGVANARNRGLTEANGEFIAFLDHDDLWLPEKLEKQLAAIQAGEKIGVVYSNWEHFDDNGTLPEGDKRIVKPQQGQIELVDLLPANSIISMSVPLIRTELLRQIGGFDSSVAPCDDWDVWIRLAEKSRITGVSETLVRYRQHADQQSGNILKMRAADRKVRRKNWRNALKHPRLIYHIYQPNIFLLTENSYYTAKDLLFQGEIKEARKEAAKCLFRHPFALFTPQWAFLMLRLFKRNSSPY